MAKITKILIQYFKSYYLNIMHALVFAIFFASIIGTKYRFENYSFDNMNNRNFFFSEIKRNYIEIQQPLQNTLRLSNEPLSNVYILIRLQLGKSLQNVKKINITTNWCFSTWNLNILGNINVMWWLVVRARNFFQPQ